MEAALGSFPRNSWLGAVDGKGRGSGKIGPRNPPRGIHLRLVLLHRIGKPLLRQNQTINSLPSSLLLAKLRMDVVNKEPHMNRAPLSYTPIEEIEKVTRELVA